MIPSGQIEIAQRVRHVVFGHVAQVSGRVIERKSIVPWDGGNPAPIDKVIPTGSTVERRQSPGDRYLIAVDDVALPEHIPAVENTEPAAAAAVHVVSGTLYALRFVLDIATVR